MHPLREIKPLPPSPEERKLPNSFHKQTPANANVDLYILLLENDKLINATNSVAESVNVKKIHGNWTVIAGKSILSMSKSITKLKDRSFRSIVICSHGGGCRNTTTGEIIDAIYWLDGKQSSDFVSSNDIEKHIADANEPKNEKARSLVVALKKILDKAKDNSNVVFMGCSIGKIEVYGQKMLDATWRLAGAKSNVYVNIHSGGIPDGFDDPKTTELYGVEIGGDLTYSKSRHGFLLKKADGTDHKVKSIFLKREIETLTPLIIK
jgi:hypothetical protein